MIAYYYYYYCYYYYTKDIMALIENNKFLFSLS